MIRNYIVVALRGVLRDKAYTALNVLGLAVGMASCLLVAGFVQLETSYDEQHTKADRIYRVLRETRDANGVPRFDHGTSGPLAAAIQAEIPEVELATRMWAHWISVKSGDRHLYRSVAVVDPAFFEIFDFEMLSGSLSDVESPRTIFLTAGNARAIFGDDDPLGRPIRVQGDHGAGDYTVAGVIADPARTTVRFDLITAHHPPGFYRPQWEDWLPGGWRLTTNYVLLREGADPDRALAKLRPMLGRHLGPELAKTDAYHLQSLPRTHLYAEVDFGTQTERSIGQVYTYVLTALLVLLIACINFVNLSTARSSRRAREVGVRKTSGATRTQLVAQFLGESVLLSLLSLCGALVLASWGQETFDQLVGVGLHPPWGLLPGAFAVAILVGVLAGIYPAIALTRPAPGWIMKGLDTAPRGARLRKGLVVSQFAASVLFAILAMTVHSQLTYIATRPLGFDKEQIVALWMINRKPELYEDLDPIKQMLLAHPNVISVAGLFEHGMLGPGAVTARALGDDADHAFHQIGTDPDFLFTFRVELKRGRNFRPRTTEAVVNESAVRAMGWKDPLGQQIKWPGEVGPLTVVGVVEDFHFQSMRSAIGPLAIYHMWFASQLNVRIEPTNAEATIAHFQEVWQKMAPEYPFDYGFIDEAIDRAYRSDRKAARLATFAAGVSGFVACLGLLGLGAFAAERRRREIAVRKVLGASAVRLVAMLSREFFLLVTAANLIAWPIAYVCARRWLDTFAYRIDLAVEIFAITAIIALALAMATVATHTLRAVRANPVDSLRGD